MAYDDYDRAFIGCKFQYREHECEIVKNHTGHLCGYVIFDIDELENIDVSNVVVHGGITFQRTDKDKHQVEVGFDCAHVWDYVPYNAKYQENYDVPVENYRDESYVRNEIRNLIDQVIDQRV